MLRRSHFPVLLGLIPILLNAGSDENFLILHYSHYRDAGPVWSYAPGLELRLWPAPNWRVDWSRELDGVSGASRVALTGPNGITPVKKVPSLLDGIAGASAVEFRTSDQINLHYDRNGTVIGSGFYIGSENDYRSLSPSVDIAVDVAERNATLAASYSWFYDLWSELNNGKKRIHSVNASYTQTLSRLTLAQIGANWIRSSGYLGRPWNPVAIAGEFGYEYLDEAMPSRKTALAGNAIIVQGWKLTSNHLLGSANFSYRYYLDSWALRSHTWELRLSQHMTPDFYIRARARYYRQTGVSFAKKTYQGNETYRTADIRYFPFYSWLFGLKLGGRFPDEWSASSVLIPDSWDIKADWLWRNTRGNPLLYQFFPADEYYTQTNIMGSVQYDF